LLYRSPSADWVAEDVPAVAVRAASERERATVGAAATAAAGAEPANTCCPDGPVTVLGVADPPPDLDVEALPPAVSPDPDCEVAVPDCEVAVPLLRDTCGSRNDGAPEVED